jgi:hypothetical protein
VLSELFEHVIEETDPRAEGQWLDVIEIYGNVDGGFSGTTGDPGAS